MLTKMNQGTICVVKVPVKSFPWKYFVQKYLDSNSCVVCANFFIILFLVVPWVGTYLVAKEGFGVEHINSYFPWVCTVPFICHYIELTAISRLLFI